MAILNYTTEVPSERTISEITGLLVRKGAQSINQEFRADGSIEAVSFVMPVGGLPVRFVLPNKVDGVARVILKDKPWHSNHRCSLVDYQKRVRAQAERVSWRILKDWVEAQLALIESGQAEMGQVFMPYAVQAVDGRSMYELFVENNQKQLGSGTP
jgi:uncharacterized beta-barrel protein YwiB (DUF1934 family)